MLLSHEPGICSFHGSHASCFCGCQDDKVWGQDREQAGDTGQAETPSPCAEPGGASPGTAPPRHCQALVHNWLKTDCDWEGVEENCLWLENLWMKFPF